MRGYLAAWEMNDRTLWVADSFEGLPVPSLPQDEGWDFSVAKAPILAIPLEEVQENSALPLARRAGEVPQGLVLRHAADRAHRHTGGAAPGRRFVRIDHGRLNALYDKVSPGGFIIVDDYGDFEPCRRAITEFREKHGITDPIEVIDWAGVLAQVGVREG